MKFSLFQNLRAFVTAAFITVCVAGTACNKMTTETLKVDVRDPPSSADPLDFDLFIHHLAFRSVLGTLTSKYTANGITPEIAESWSSSADQKVWRFKIREGLTFADGTKIDAEAVRASLTRIIFLMLKRKSKNELLDSLGLEVSWKSATQNIQQIRTEGNSLVINLKRSNEKLHDTLSFGTYAIASTKDFDNTSGEWINKKKVTASGSYIVSKWDDENFELNLRKNTQQLPRHQSAFPIVIFVWKNEARLGAQIVTGYKSESYPGMRYYGPVPANIGMLICSGYKSVDSPFKSRETRTRARDWMYELLEREGVSTRTFFPLSMKGISEITYTLKKAPPDLKGMTLKLTVLERKSRIKAFAVYQDSVDEFARGMNALVKHSFTDFDTYFAQAESGHTARPQDLFTMVTGILIDDPVDDARFMFKSKEGIRIPDETGEIIAELDRPKPDLQKVNQLIWEQALIWPIAQFSSGVWVKEGIDYSKIRIDLPPTQISWIGKN